MAELKSALSIRGDSQYCPLSLQLDTYWMCEADCAHCYMRRLNRTWGRDLRPVDLGELERKLRAGARNANPKTALAHALSAKKTIRLGNKADPYQDAELTHRRTRAAVRLLLELDWTFIVQTMFTRNMMEDLELFRLRRDLAGFMAIVSPGLEDDWRLFERERTTNPMERLAHLEQLQREGFRVGVNGEPFIPGHHTPEQFREALRAVKAHGIRSYNTYHLHFNDLVAKNFHELGLDIERIWWHNQDEQWRPILRQLIGIAREEGMTLGCPDFVNSGSYQEPTNTCCGMDVPNPCTFNVIQWKKLYLSGITDPDEIIARTWDGIGDKEQARQIILGTAKDTYTLKDIAED